MTSSTKKVVPNSVILIEDQSGGEIPNSMNQSLIAATASCIAVGCRAEDDGETEIILGHCDNVASDKQPMFEGALRTPSQKLVVRTVLGDTLLEMPVATAETKLIIWVNDQTEPDHIVVGVM